jgi:hypothetical protein
MELGLRVLFEGLVTLSSLKGNVMKFRTLLPMLALIALLTAPVIGTAEEEAVKKECEKCAKCEEGEKCAKCSKCPLSGLKCPVSGKDIDKGVTAAHHGGKIFFCCEHSLSAWNKDAAKDGEKKFVAQANYQLVASRQAKQKGCPMSGNATKDTTAIVVGANKAKVSFCCGHCQENAEKKEGADQIAMLFSEKAFANAFKLVKKEKKEAAVQ